MTCTLINKHDIVFHLAFNNGVIIQHTLGQDLSTNYFSLQHTYGGTEIFQQALTEAELEMSDLLSAQLKGQMPKERA